MTTPSAPIQTLPRRSESRKTSRHASSIESWNLSVPGRSMQAHTQRQQSSASDPAVMAYLQLKMALLRRKTDS
ncbi:hypothetical protein SLS58_004378 [Diplodia intermedia]|uniref:Uncharacterized protein n=1 Tax=Diplodia intermedia TaxID=856260 RepID=A0ABR3TTW1_9PEZI